MIAKEAAFLDVGSHACLDDDVEIVPCVEEPSHDGAVFGIK